jgi:acyl carrier protein
MTEAEILSGLAEVLEDVLDLEDVKLANETTAKEIEGWDSLAQIRILLATEEKFKVSFDTSEMGSLPNVGALAKLILRKLNR